MTRQRKVMLGVGVLLATVLASVVAIAVMLERLEARNAAFQPPMTALERQRLLPHDPVLDATPKLDGLRYGDHQDPSAKDSGAAGERLHTEHAPGEALMREGDAPHANAIERLHAASRTQ